MLVQYIHYKTASHLFRITTAHLIRHMEEIVFWVFFTHMSIMKDILCEHSIPECASECIGDFTGSLSVEYKFRLYGLQLALYFVL